MIAFGPVPSRRLGYSLGINHIPPKHCPYSCVYCQVGRTTNLGLTRQEFYPINQVLSEVEDKILACQKAGKKINYLSLVPDGEPTLDINLGKLIEELKEFKIPVAVISNASLINQSDVQDELMPADWISLKVDAVIEKDWHQVNRPNGRLILSSILEDILSFRAKYKGILVTETMLISGINDSETAILNLCAYLDHLKPDRSYLALPIRPPAESWVKSPNASSLEKVLQIFSDRISFMDLLFETETGDFQTTGDPADDVLSITAVHPLREEPLRKMLDDAGANWHIIEDLISTGKITKIRYQDENFYLRR